MRRVYDHIALIDTSFVVAWLHDADAEHVRAQAMMDEIRADDLTYCVADVISHESFTRLRYDVNFTAARDSYSFLRESGLQVLRFDQSDEASAILALEKHKSQKLSFIDALCAALMLKNGIYKIVTFDSDFSIFGMQILPGRPLG